MKIDFMPKLCVYLDITTHTMNTIGQWKNFTNIVLPDWVAAEQRKLQSRSYVSDEDRMGLVLQCAKQNVNRLMVDVPLSVDRARLERIHLMDDAVWSDANDVLTIE